MWGGGCITEDASRGDTGADFLERLLLSRNMARPGAVGGVLGKETGHSSRACMCLLGDTSWGRPDRDFPQGNALGVQDLMVNVSFLTHCPICPHANPAGNIIPIL